jgi:hypothetical protein
MTREEIDDVICDIMVYDGPDKHVDGHDKITDFIISLLYGNPAEWIDNYRVYKEEKDAAYKKWLGDFRC